MPTKACHQFAATGSCSYGGRCKFQHVRMTNSPAKPKKSYRAPRQSKVLSASASRYAEFFANYPDFDYEPSNSVTNEFYRMCDFFGWDKNDSERVAAHEALKDELVQAFNTLYGVDENDIEAWRRLCRALRINPIPETLAECRSAVLAIHVNLVDLVDKNYRDVRIFPNLEALQEYTRRGKYFPRENAYAGGLLRFLLREIDSKYKGDRKTRRR